jgi:hypothetical protein
MERVVELSAAIREREPFVAELLEKIILVK